MLLTDSQERSIHLPENEDTWDAILETIIALTAICRDGACDEQPEQVLLTMRSISRPLVDAMKSDRSRLSGPAIELVSVVSSGLGMSFEPLLSLFFPTLLLLCSRTSKVLASRAKGCIFLIIESTQLGGILPYLAALATDKSTSLRLAIAEAGLACINSLNPEDLEKESRIRDIEKLIKAAAKDSSAEVRTVSKKFFAAYKDLFPSRVTKFAAPLTPTTKKCLEIRTVLPAVGPQPTTKPIPSTSSRTKTQSSSDARPRPKSFSETASRPRIKSAKAAEPPIILSQTPVIRPTLVSHTSKLDRRLANMGPPQRSLANSSNGLPPPVAPVLPHRPHTSHGQYELGPRRLPLVDANHQIKPSREMGHLAQNPRIKATKAAPSISSQARSQIVKDTVVTGKVKNTRSAVATAPTKKSSGATMASRQACSVSRLAEPAKQPEPTRTLTPEPSGLLVDHLTQTPTRPRAEPEFKTPIASLLFSIQQGFEDFSPESRSFPENGNLFERPPGLMTPFPLNLRK